MPSRADDLHDLKLSLRRLTQLLGVAQILLGCLVGLAPSGAVAWFRGLVMAHVEYTGNGVLLVALASLVPGLRLGRVGLWLWFWTLQAGTWLNGSAALLAAVRGRSSRFLAAASAASPPPRGMADPVVTAMLVTTGLCVLIGLALTLVGQVRAWRPGAAALEGSARPEEFAHTP